MATQSTMMTRHDLEAAIIQRCWEDDSFRQAFTTDPAATLAKHLKVPVEHVPPTVVHEEPAGTWHLVIPAKPANGGELSEEDLEKVAGGVIPALPLLIFGVIMAATVIGPTIALLATKKS